MAATKDSPRTRTLGTIATPEAAKRDSLRQGSAITARGDGVQTAKEITIPVGGTVSVPHGLRTKPSCAQFSAVGAAAPGVFISARTDREVSLTNDGPDPATVEVAIFG